MIKGCNKRVVVVKDTGNSVIEEAFFILKPGCETGSVSSDNILKHANSILGRSAYAGRFSGMNVSSKENKGKYTLSFWLGVFIGAASAILFVILF